MSQIAKLPKEARKVVRILRRDVPKPAKLPKLGRQCENLTWQRKRNGKLEKICPMGLHRQSTACQPYDGDSFNGGVCDDYEVRAFWEWWDDLTDDDAAAAVNRVWGRKPK